MSVLKIEKKEFNWRARQAKGCMMNRNERERNEKGRKQSKDITSDPGCRMKRISKLMRPEETGNSKERKMQPEAGKVPWHK